MRLKKDKQGMALEVYKRRKTRIRKRLDEFIDQEWKQKHARRLQKRLRRHREELITFLDHDEVPPDNNGGERGKVDPNHWTVFCRFLASEIPLGISLVPVTQA